MIRGRYYGKGIIQTDHGVGAVYQGTAKGAIKSGIQEQGVTKVSWRAYGV